MRWLTALVLLSLVAACTGNDAAPPLRPAAAKSSKPERASDMTQVVFRTRTGDHRVAVEVARSPEQLSRGLMYRSQMDWDRGMLFIFPSEEQQSFWMKNTLIPLDMIFVKEDMTVLGVVHRAEPRTLSPRRVEGASMYVVEVNGGWAAEHGVEAGTEVRFEGLN